MLVADGNFEADHVKAKAPSQDVWLSEGGGMDPKCSVYWAFLKTALEHFTVCILAILKTYAICGAQGAAVLTKYSQKAPCKNMFRAIMNMLLASKVCDVTGKVSMACARHGCYCPGSLVDLYHGKQQKNVDFALLEAIKNVHPKQGVLLIYSEGQNCSNVF